MSDHKPWYHSPQVTIARGYEDAKQTASEAGMAPEEVDKMLDFVEWIIAEAQQRGVPPSLCFVALLNAMCFLLLHMVAEGERGKLVGAVTEALVAVIGGGSDMGVRG